MNTNNIKISVYTIILDFLPNDLAKIVRRYVVPLNLNQSMLYQDIQDVLLMDGAVESNSPKNRDKLYSFLQKNKIKYITNIIGYTKGEKYLANSAKRKQYGIKWNIGRIMKWINQGRILLEDVKQACECDENGAESTDNSIDCRCDPNPITYRYYFVFDDVKQIFDKTIPYKKRCNILKEQWGEFLLNTDWTPFSRIRLHKTIVRIELD